MTISDDGSEATASASPVSMVTPTPMSMHRAEAAFLHATPQVMNIHITRRDSGRQPGLPPRFGRVLSRQVATDEPVTVQRPDPAQRAGRG
jgi:hypothetical protein